MKKLFSKRKDKFIENIKISGIFKIAYDLNLHNAEMGFLIQAQMKSGKIAVFELINIERARGVDWFWYEFKFHHWKKENESYPIYC